jgi:hypothetical protein
MELRNEKSKIKKRCIAYLLYVYFHRQVGDASEEKSHERFKLVEAFQKKEGSPLSARNFFE